MSMKHQVKYQLDVSIDAMDTAWCDIDGHGQQWRLAISLDDEQIAFPHDNFDDYAEHYLKYPAREIVKPLEPEDMP